MAAVLSIPTRLTHVAGVRQPRLMHVAGERDERLVGRGWVSGRTPARFILGARHRWRLLVFFPDELHLRGRGTNRGAAYDGQASGEEHEVVLREGGRWPTPMAVPLER